MDLRVKLIAILLAGGSCAFLAANPCIAQPAGATAIGGSDSLALQYLAITRYDERLREQWKTSWRFYDTFCNDDACKTDLNSAEDRIIDEIAKESIPRLAHLIASHVNDADLQAGITFAQSDAGQRLTKAGVETAPAMGALSTALTLTGLHELADRFCPAHAQVCTKWSAQNAQGQ